MRSKTMSVISAVLVSLSLTGGAAALSLETFVGSWQGRGELQNNNLDTQRPVQCALDGRQSAPLIVELTLKCASRQSLRTVVITIEQSKNGAIESVLVDLPSGRATGFSAHFSDHSILLQHPDEGRLLLERGAQGIGITLNGMGALSGTINLQ